MADELHEGDPQYEVESEKSGRTAVHRPSVLHEDRPRKNQAQEAP